MNNLPFIAVDISQPGDKGEFHIAVSDMKTRQTIVTNRLQEDRSMFDYLYNSRLIEGGGMGVALMQDDSKEIDKQERSQDLVRYGQRLYQDLFGKKNALKHYMAKQPHLSKGACFILRLHDTASELWNIPWEYIHDGSQFLGLNPQFSILRYLVDTKRTRPFPDLNQLPNPLRILFVIANPRNSVPLNVEAEINRIQRAIQSASEKRLVEVEYVEHGTLQNLENALTKRDFHILHYSGHGAMSSKGSLLVMEDAKGMAEPVFLDKLLPVIGKAQSLRLVFLSACKAGNINETLASSGIASGLMRVVPAVVAMQFSILDSSATKLAEAFYGEVGRGKTLEESLFVSRQALHNHNEWLGDWGVPALYIHKPNMRLLDVTKERKIFSIAGRHDLSALPQAEPFTGRRDEQNEIRETLKDEKIPFVYIWGMAGVGKSALVHQVIRRPGQDARINDVLILRCDQMNIHEIIGAFQQWIGRHFATTQQALTQLSKLPREVIKKIEQQVHGKNLILVLDHVDTMMVSQEDRYWRFDNSLAEAFFIGLVRAHWSVTTIMTARFRWHYMAQLPESNYKNIHLSALSPADTSFILSERAVFRNQDKKLMGQFLNMVGGHPATLDYVAKHLEAKPQLLADTRLESSLVRYWHKSFLSATRAMLSEGEREILKLMCIHDSVFSPRMVQLLGNLATEDEAIEMMVAWEMLSLADFIYVDQDEIPLYLIPNVVRTYFTSSMDEAEKRHLHAQFADVIQQNYYNIIVSMLEKAENKPIEIQLDEFETVLDYLDYVLQQPDPEFTHHYLQITSNWQKHFREAGMVEQANRIVLTFIGILHNFGDVEATDHLIKTVRQSGNLSPEVDLHMRYWSAVRLMDDRKYETAEKVMYILEGKTQGKKGVEKLHANILERHGEILRGMGDTKGADKKWIQALDEYERLDDKLGIARILLYFTEQSYYSKNLDKAESRLEKALKALYQTNATGPGLQLQGKLALYKGHIARLKNNGTDTIHYYSIVCDIGMSISDGSLVAQGLEHMGYYYGLMRQYEVASMKLLQALDIYEKQNDQTGLSLVLMKLAVIQDFRGNGKEAYAFCQRSHRIAQTHNLAHLSDVEILLKRLKRKGS